MEGAADASSKEALRRQRLEKLIDTLEEKKKLSEEFTKLHDIDFRLFFNPEDPRYVEKYDREDLSKENMLMAVRLRTATRTWYILGAFVGYHITKSILWRYGYFAKFFYRQRFLSIPVLIGANIWNVRKTIQEFKDAGVLDYMNKRNKFVKDKELVEALLKNIGSVK